MDETLRLSPSFVLLPLNVSKLKQILHLYAFECLRCMYNSIIIIINYFLFLACNTFTRKHLFKNAVFRSDGIFHTFPHHRYFCFHIGLNHLQYRVINVYINVCSTKMEILVLE